MTKALKPVSHMTTNNSFVFFIFEIQKQSEM